MPERHPGDVSGGAPPKPTLDLDTFLKAAEACQKGGHALRHRARPPRRTRSTRSARFFHAYGAVLVDAKGEIVVKNDQVRQALDYYKKLDGVPAGRCSVVGRRLQQQWLVSGRAR